MAYEITTRLSTLPEAPTLAEGGTPEFDNKAFPFVAAWTTVYNEINALSTEMNGMSQWVEDQINNVDLTALEAIRDETLSYSQIAAVAANYGGEWNSTDDFAGKAVVDNCLLYISKIAPPDTNIGHQPLNVDDNSDPYWAKLSRTAPIDEQLRNFTATGLAYDANNKLMREDYEGGYHITYTYDANDNLETETYSDSNDHVLLTITYRYDANNKIISITRS